MAKLQVQVAPEGRQVQQQGALARPDARGGGGRAGTPALSGPGGAGQRRQVHVVGTHPPRQHHLHVGRRVADSCGERRDASARRGPPGRPPSLRPPAAHGVQRWARRASTGTTGPERALPSLPSPRHLRAGQLLRPGPAPPGKGSSAAARPPPGTAARHPRPETRRLRGRPGAAWSPVLRPRPAPPRPRALSAVRRRTRAAQAGGGRQDALGGQEEGGRERHGREGGGGRGSATCARVQSPNQQQQQGQDERRQQGAVTHGTWEEQPPGRSRRSRSARGGGASRSEALQPLEKVISAADKPNVVNPKPRLLPGKQEAIGLWLSPAPPPPPPLARTGLNQGA